MVLGEALGRSLGYEGEALMDGISDLRRRDMRELAYFSGLCQVKMLQGDIYP